MTRKSAKHDEEYTTYLDYLKAFYPNTDHSLIELNDARDIGTHIAKEAIKKARKTIEKSSNKLRKT